MGQFRAQLCNCDPPYAVSYDRRNRPTAKLQKNNIVPGQARSMRLQNDDLTHLLKVSDRTIERDKKAIRENNAISQDPELANVIAGRLVDEAQICIQRIRKFERDDNCPPAAKIEGEKGCFHIVNSLAERLQSMGYLPIAAKKLEAYLTHHTDNQLSLDEIESEAQRLQNIKTLLPLKKTKKVKSRTVKQKEKKQ